MHEASAAARTTLSGPRPVSAYHQALSALPGALSPFECPSRSYMVLYVYTGSRINRTKEFLPELSAHHSGRPKRAQPRGGASYVAR